MVGKPIAVSLCFIFNVEQYLKGHFVCLNLSLDCKILPVNIAYMNIMLNIVKYFLKNEYFWLGNQKKCFGIFAQPRPCWLKQ